MLEKKSITTQLGTPQSRNQVFKEKFYTVDFIHI